MINIVILVFAFIVICFGSELEDKLFQYCSENDVAGASRILNQNEDLLNKRMDSTGYTPLMLSSLSGSHDVVKFLLDRGADPSIAENDGYTPMHGAAFQGQAAVIKVLLEYGIDPSDVHKDGYRPIHRAAWGKEKKHAAAVKALLEGGVSPFETTKDGIKTARSLTKNKATSKLLKAWERKLEHAQEGGNVGEPSTEL